MVSIVPSPLSPAALLQPSFPPAEETVPFAQPDALRIPLPEIDAPEQLPRFLLLGERDDASFERTDRGFTIDYVWPAFADGPVCQLRAEDAVIDVEELWSGQILCHSFGRGDTLAQALLYHYRATLASRDCLRQWFQDQFGIEWHLPAPGVRQRVSQPEGILRALVVPCQPGEGDRLAQLAGLYCDQPNAYAVDGCQQSSGGEVLYDVECRLFVGAWRAVVELARFLAAHRWDLAAGPLAAFSVCPYELVKSWRVQQPGDNGNVSDVLYPPLLPPQECLGVAEGVAPAPLGDLTPYRSGGPTGLQRILHAAVDKAFPVDDGPVLFAMANPKAPFLGGCPRTAVLGLRPLECPSNESVEPAFAEHWR